MRVFFFAAAATALLAASPFNAQEAVQLPSECVVRDSTRVISLVICDKGLSQDMLSQAGRAACGEREPCGAWFWVDPVAAPEKAPENHDGLTQDQIASSLGVWVAESEMLISIEAVNQ